MRHITKGAEPPRLVAEKKKRGGTYDGLSAACKSEIRQALLRDQGWLCCYCMQRIGDDWKAMKIEHFRSQAAHPELQVAWSNLLAACLGGEGLSRADQHCDTRKGERAITLDPTSSTVTSQIRYLRDGLIAGSTAAATQEVNSVLGLNHELLRRNRRARLDGMINAMMRVQRGAWGAAEIGRRIAFEETPRNGRLPEYSGMVVAWLRKRLARAAPTTGHERPDATPRRARSRPARRRR